MVKWVNTAPVIEIPPKDYQSFVNTFRESLKGWDLDNPVGNDAQRWNKRFGKTVKIMEEYGDKAQEFNFAYMLDGRPVGILTANEGQHDRMLVHALFCHVGQKDAGSILIEHIVNFTVGHGMPGDIYLASEDKDSTDFYLICGFEIQGGVDKDGGAAMLLEPASSEKWALLGNTWRLKAYVGTSIYAT
ncbi:MAG: hypothetical protein ACREF3_03200 [Acetobacteraceae bacterium]